MKVVMLAGPKSSTWIVANALRGETPLAALIVESLPPRWRLAERRARRIGWPAVIGQALFILYAAKLQFDTRCRAAQILAGSGLDPRPPDGI
ncbi:MAG TPA: hypothetical protein VKR61_04580, partial [Bryobacteraceae bacterium]|nr:hypothetical protein [Bryobacteraceae bacterium]